MTIQTLTKVDLDELHRLTASEFERICAANTLTAKQYFETRIVFGNMSNAPLEFPQDEIRWW
jgi:hypothetical protein